MLAYFVGSAVISLLRLIRAPVLRGLTHKFFFNYTISLVVLQLIFYIGMFFAGNSIFIAAWKPQQECNPDSFNPTMLLAIMGTIMTYYWFILAGLVQLVLFVLILSSVWDGIMYVSQGMQRGFSLGNLLECLLRLVGEGEI